jgi:low temperature requirement protein LtrA
MTGRDTGEAHRVSTPLELLFDLTFVVAVSRAAGQLAHAVSADHLEHGIFGYLSVFFAIWWAWMNFTWFASAYDTDDIPYRLLTLLQMAGVLVLAAGVPSAFDNSFTVVVIGYVLMRVAMIAQWLRAMRGDPDHRYAARRYAIGTAIVQLAWIGRLALPHELAAASFLVLAAADICVPFWAERDNMTGWHPHHIAERYGLFTIIVLGECVLAASNAVPISAARPRIAFELVLTSLGALVLLFALWWLYFQREVGDELARRRGGMSFRWGYGHYGIFASLAAVGSGLEVSVAAITEHPAAGPRLVALAVAVPVSIYLLLLWWLHSALTEQASMSLLHVLGAVAATLLIALAAPALGTAWTVAALCVPAVVLAGLSARDLHRIDGQTADPAA